MSENLVQYVVAAGNGDTQAMGMLYAKTLKSSYFLASKLSGSDNKAVEIAKKAYARAFCSIEKLKKPEAFEIWLKQIIASIYKDGEKFIFADADGNAQEPSGDFLPEAVLEDGEKAAKISDAVDKLTPERRTAVILHYNNGMPVNALSKFLGVSESTANAVLSKAREDILAFSGVEAAAAPEFATLPVLTRLFADLTAKTGVDNDAVRDIFAFAVDAYKAAKEAEEKAEAEEAQTVASAEETAVEAAEDTAEEAAEEAACDGESDDGETEDSDENADENSAEDAAEDADEASEEDAGEKDIEAEIDEEKAQMEENILSFKNKISSMLGIDSEEKTEVEDSAEDGEADTADEAEKTEDTDDTVSDVSDEEATADDSSEEYSVDDDAFDRIRRSVEGLDTVTEISDEESSEDVGAISFADFGGESANIQISEEAKTEEKAEVKPEIIPAKKNEKKAAKVNPKIVIIAIAVLAVIVIAVALLVKGGSKEDTPTTTAPVSDTVKAPVKWTALPELSEYKEIEFLNEKFNSFKDPDTGKYGLIDYLGNVVLAPEYDGFRRCSSGRYYGEGRLDESGYHVFALKDGQAYEVVMMTDTATVSNEPHAEHAYINNSSMSGGDYDERDRYYEGYAAVRKDGKWGYVAQNSGKLVVPYEFEAVNEVPADDPSQAYDYCRGSSNGYVAVKKGGKMGVIKIEKDAYKVVAELTYDMIYQGKGGVFLAYNGTEWGTITVGTGSVQGDAQNEITTLPPEVTNPVEISIGKYVVNDDETNIRTSPDTENDDNVITALNKGYEINALEKKEGSNGSEWIRFEYEGKRAWVSSKKLDKAE